MALTHRIWNHGIIKAKNTFKKTGLKFKLVSHNSQYIIDLMHALNCMDIK